MNKELELLLRVVSSLKNSEFLTAVNNAGLTEDEKNEVISLILARGE